MFAEFETILTSVELDKLPPAPVPASKTDGGSPAKKGKKKRKEAAAPAMQKRFRLPKEETERIERLLQRSVDRESGKECDLNVTEDNPDGREFRKRFIDLSCVVTSGNYRASASRPSVV